MAASLMYSGVGRFDSPKYSRSTPSIDMAISASSRMRERGTFSTELARRGTLTSLLLLLLIPQPARQHAAAERTIVDAHEAVPLFSEHQVVFGIDLVDDGAVGELIGL